jgi:hypothetical protein
VYRNKVVLAVYKLVRDRFLICDDTQDIVTRLLAAGTAAGVPAPRAGENAAAPDPVPACVGRIKPHYHSITTTAIMITTTIGARPAVTGSIK